MNVVADRPVHISESAVYDFDIFRDAELLKDPHQRALDLAKNAPAVFWTPHNGGHWMAIRYEDVQAISRSPDVFSSAIIPAKEKQAIQAAMPPGTPRFPQLVPIFMDPPEHTKFRMPLHQAFSPKTIMGLQEDITALAHQLIDEVINLGACDFISTVAEQFPVRIFLKMMGLPSERLIEFRAFAREVFEPKEISFLASGTLNRKMADAMMSEILDRRDNPKKDLISLLWTLKIDGNPITLELIEDYAVLLFLAGLDTVVNAIAFGMRHLASHPELQNTLRGNPDLIPNTTEELLRRYTFTVPMRRVIQDTQLGGWTLKAGDLVMMYSPAANLDAKEYPQPENFDVTRNNEGQLVFGYGPHRCLGRNLARLELHTLYKVVLERLPTFRLDSTKPIHFHAGHNLSMDALHLRWD